MTVLQGNGRGNVRFCLDRVARCCDLSGQRNFGITRNSNDDGCEQKNHCLPEFRILPQTVESFGTSDERRSEKEDCEREQNLRSQQGMIQSVTSMFRNLYDDKVVKTADNEQQDSNVNKPLPLVHDLF